MKAFSCWILCSLAFLGVVTAPATAKDEHKFAKAAYERGDYDQAIKFAVIRLKQKTGDKDTMKVLIGSAQAAYRKHQDAARLAKAKGDYDTALQEYETLRDLDLEISSLPPLIKYEKQPLSQFLPKIEIDLLTEIEKLRGNAAENHRRAGEEAFEKGDYRKAQQEFEQASKLGDSDSRERAVEAKRRADQEEAERYYQAGLVKFSEQKYRQAYADFNAASRMVPGYKDAQRYSGECLEKGKIRFAIARFINSTGTELVDAVTFSDFVIGTIVVNKSPFLQVLDREYLERILQEHRLAYSGLADSSQAVQAGKLANVRYIIIGRIVDARHSTSSPMRATQQAWTRRQEQYVDDKGRVKVKDVLGEPRTYYVVQQSLSVACEANFQIIDVETAEIINSGNASLSDDARVQYAEYQGNPQELHIETSVFGFLKTVSMIDQTPFYAARDLPDPGTVARDLSKRVAADIGRKINIFFTRLIGN